jgi:WhiB family redox-sensing transcriptional regulator
VEQIMNIQANRPLRRGHIALTVNPGLRPCVVAPSGETAHNPPAIRSPQTPSRSTNVSILASSLTLGAADYEWRDDAICRDTDPELFFPVGTTGHALYQIDRAKQVCTECNVAKQCLDFALDTNQDSGIWGGLTEEERRVIRRRRVAAARAARAS